MTTEAFQRIERSISDGCAHLQAKDVRALLESHEVIKRALLDLFNDINELVANSHGVAGLHLNGDVAEWQALLPGGCLEEWLISHERAGLVLAECPRPAAVTASYKDQAS